MSDPIWVDCETVADVSSPEQLAAQASNGHHVVLRFSSLQPDEEEALISRLSVALPDYSVFRSSSGQTPVGVTVKPVDSLTAGGLSC